MGNYISKLKWAWQAQFLSYVLLILRNNLFFEDKQMILLSLSDISAGLRFQKNLKSFPIQFLSHLCPGVPGVNPGGRLQESGGDSKVI